MVFHFDQLVDVEDLPIFANIVTPAKWKSSFLSDHAVGFGHFSSGVAKNRIIEFELFCKPRVVFIRIATGGKVSNIKLPDGIAALTERLTFERSATSERFGEPGDHNRLLPFEIGKFVRLAVASGKLEVGSCITHF